MCRTLPALGVILSAAFAFPSGAQPIGPEFRVNTFTTSDQRLSSAAMNGSGDFVVVWSSKGQDGDLDGIFGQRYTSSGSPAGSEFQVNSYTTLRQAYPSAVMGGSGDFVVVWQGGGQDGSSNGIFGQRYTSSGSRAGSEFRVNSYTTSVQGYPSVAMDGSGDFVVVWASSYQDGANYGVFGQRYTSSGSPAGSEFRVNSYTTFGQFIPSVAMAGSGDFVVVWESGQGQDGAGYGVFGQRYASSGSPVGPEFPINTFTTSDQGTPSAAMDGSGDFVVVWQGGGQDGANYGVFGQRYTSAGSPAGPEFRVNTYTTSEQLSPRAAMDGSGDFVAVWRSKDQDGAGYGIFGQRFCPPLVSVTIGVGGSTSVCATGTGGTATVTDTGGGATTTHQWAWRPTGGMTFMPIPGATGTAYQIQGADFNGGASGSYELVCETFPGCPAMTMAFSNIVPVTVSADGTAPVVTPPAASSTTQTLCQ